MPGGHFDISRRGRHTHPESVNVKRALGGFVNEYHFGEGRYHWFIERFLLCHRGHLAVIDEA